MSRSPIITLTTDFGYDSHYVAQMKGAILSIAPEACIVDISHSVPAQDVAAAAWILAAAIDAFPQPSIHLVVVDPGVGSERDIVAVELPCGRFVAPDNGVLTRVVRRSSLLAAVRVTEKEFWRADVSNTFHGRDVMGPVAAYLSQGVPLDRLGPSVKAIRELQLCQPELQGDSILGQIEYRDSFGNLVSNISRHDCAALLTEPGLGLDRLLVSLAGRDLVGIQRCYADVEAGTLLALFDSNGQLEVALSGGSAAARLSAERGEPIRVGVGSTGKGPQ